MTLVTDRGVVITLTITMFTAFDDTTDDHGKLRLIIYQPVTSNRALQSDVLESALSILHGLVTP